MQGQQGNRGGKQAGTGEGGCQQGGEDKENKDMRVEGDKGGGGGPIWSILARGVFYCEDPSEKE